MKPALILMLSLPLALLAGCASNERSAAEWAYHTAALQTASEQANKPLCSLECPDTGCKIERFTCSSPQKFEPPTIPRQKNWVDGLQTVAGVAGQAIVPGFMYGQTNTAINTLGEVSIWALDKMQGHGETHTTNIGDYSGQNAGRTGDYSGDSSGNSGAQGDYSGAGSGNSGELVNDVPGRVDSPDEIDNSDRSTDNSSTGGGSGF